MMVIALVLLLAAPQAGRAGELYGRTTFLEAEPEGEVQAFVVERVRKKEVWVDAYRQIEAKLGPFPDVAVEVRFDLEGGHPSDSGTEEGGKAWVAFNLPYLAEYQGKINAIEAQRKALKLQGKRLAFKVPPLQIERLAHHELTKIFLRGLEVPEWFEAGIASFIQEDENYVRGFAVGGATVEAVDAPPAKKEDLFGRGHLFFQWLDSKRLVKKVVAATVLAGEADVKAAIAEAAGKPWERVSAEERSWSALRAARLR